ncbi:MAG TPA: hypothetical protein VG206_21540 [Terriglobia bacterium]|nr:hypothetical protein [Terriglobia bacterium]
MLLFPVASSVTAVWVGAQGAGMNPVHPMTEVTALPPPVLDAATNKG